MASDFGYTSEQLQKLEQLFQECQFPSKEQIKQWSKDLAMHPDQINCWFKNKMLLLEIEEKRQENNLLRLENTRIELENMVIKNELDSLPRCHTCLRNETHENLALENAILRDEHQRVTNILVGILQDPALLQVQGQDTKEDVDVGLRLAPPTDNRNDKGNLS